MTGVTNSKLLHKRMPALNSPKQNIHAPTKAESAHCTTSARFFSLWYGRSRSKARSLHEKKLLLRKLLHGHRWSHAARQIKQKPKHNPPKTKGKTQIPQPDLRLTIQRTAKQTANGARAQQKQPQKICQGHSGKNPLCRN